MVLVSIFFTRIRSTEGSSAGVLYSFVAPCLALHLAVKILLQIFLYEDLSTLTLTCRLYFPPRECQQDRTFVTQPILLSENIPNIWHKSSTKPRRVRPDWNDKNDNANYAPSYHMEGFTQWLRLPFLKIFDQVRKDLDCELFYSELKRHNVTLLFTI